DDGDDLSMDDFSLDEADDTAKAEEAVFDSLDDDDEISLDDSSDDFALNDDVRTETVEDIDFEEASDISLDMDADDFGFDDEDEDDLDGPIAEEGDEVSTKLDLARAYMDMGDADGAKEILNEVVAEGNDAQQSEAKSLLAKLD
ncbi:MAG: tetratricopeptide repeat protein, partial [Xanthomonadales bacterium]|nr:tetratricopeptide repeat protein [Xanthomonadales bacterium]